MATFATHGIDLYYELHGEPGSPPLLLISGLGGMGVSWGPQVARFAANNLVILPDQRGTGRSTHALDGYSTEQLAEEMAALITHLAVGPIHVVGSSTGGAVAQYLVLNHPELLRSLTISSSFARFDAFIRREFTIRRKIAAEWTDPHDILAANSLFLFSPRYTRNNPERVQTWIDRAASHPAQPQDREIALKRIDMVMAHDALARLGEIKLPTLVLCADGNYCTPLPLSEEIAHAIPGAELVILHDAGELIELEREDTFFGLVSNFIGRH